MTKIKEKSKWLLALLLCVSCLAVCMSVLLTGTLAAVQTGATFTPVSGYPNLYEVLDSAGQPLNPKQYIYSTTQPTSPAPAGYSPLAAYAKDSKYYVASGNTTYPYVYLVLLSSGTLDQGNGIWAGPNKTFGDSDDQAVVWQNSAYYYKDAYGNYTQTVPTGDAGTTYAAVAGYPNLYQVLNNGVASGYVFTIGTPSASSPKAYFKDAKYYTASANAVYPDVYLVILSTGTVDTNNGIWAGPNKTFGDSDDQAVIWQNSAYYYKDAYGNYTQAVPTSTAGTTYAAVTGYPNLYQVLTNGVASGYVYSTGTPGASSPKAYLKDSKYYVAGNANYPDVYLLLLSSGALDSENGIWAGVDKTFNTADDKVIKLISGVYYYADAAGNYTQAIPMAPQRFQLVSGYAKNLYEALDSNGASYAIKRYIYTIANIPSPVPADYNPAPAYLRDGKFYTERVDYKTVYLLIKADGTLDDSDAWWSGPDKAFGSGDDKKAVKRADGNFYYEISAGEYEIVWLDNVKGNTLAPTSTTTTTSSTSSTSATSSTSGSDTTTSTTNSFLQTDGPKEPSYPNTGKGINKALVICMALLLGAGCYCGYRFFRREKRRRYSH
ncbi:MAG: hypothetical protein LBG83_00870 [Oscillospiraceae bacterium]|jgi:hypothetical protein|nr:hypothetical protein [Oscillospiraceae bacterium]